MARIRSIKPGFCTSEPIASLSIPCRLHFAMLWTYCDDHGRGVDSARIIKGALWPLDDAVTVDQIEEWQAELADTDRIVRYTVDGRKFFYVLRWYEHQKPNRRAKSELPPPPGEPDAVSAGQDPETPHAPPTQCAATAEAVREQCADTVGGEGRGVGGEEERRGVRGEPPGQRTAAAPPAAAAAPPADHEATLLAAVDLLLARDGTTAEAQTKRNPNRWLASARRGRADDHRDQATTLLAADPTLTAEQLAEHLEPDQIKPERANPTIPDPDETAAARAAYEAESPSPEERAEVQRRIAAAKANLSNRRSPDERPEETP